MIFLSLGTHEQPFSRAIDLLGQLDLDHEEVVIQNGCTPRADTPSDARWVEFIGYGDFQKLVGASRVFICHAGVGSLLTAFNLGVLPVVVAREPDRGEHVDAHQVELATRLNGLGAIELVEGNDLRAAIDRLGRRSAGPSRTQSTQLVAAVRRAIAPI